MRLPFFWRWLRCWYEGYVQSAPPFVWPVVCLLPPGVSRMGLGSPLTRPTDGAWLPPFVLRVFPHNLWYLYQWLWLWPPLDVFLHFAQPLVGCGADYMGLAPLSCCPTSSDTDPLAQSLPICLDVHRFPCASVCVYVVIAWLSSGLLLCVRPAPSIETGRPSLVVRHAVP
ncbi:hypothetical protein V6N12_068346 [Hibiscus sabdariffa]|uniref:Uncharacterized protein n=1 Tax=Hibiscus sabdariffa TaxID=183260 RepID=A0ABR2FPQ1_9ROSI